MRALDSFAGVGWHIGARALGIEEEGIEIMPEAVATRDAIGAKTVHDDVWTYDYRPGSHEGKIDSPPCQTFSLAGNGAGRKALDDVLSIIRSGAWRDLEQLRAAGASLGEDERTALVLMPLHAWHIIRPEWVTWEQVPTVQPVWDACAELMREAGYSVWTGRLQAEQYGVPQTRKRSILIASKCHVVGMPQPTHSRYYPRSKDKLDPGVRKWVSMAEALGWGMTRRPSMTVTGGGTGAGGAEPFGNAARQGMIRELEAGDWLFAGAGATAVETAGQVRRPLGEPAHTITGKGTAAWVPTAANEGDTLDDMAWVHERPSPTIVGSFAPDVVAAPGYRGPGDGPRQKAKGSVRVTVQEAAILQSFPADMPWQGSSTKQYLQVGNAVPPGLAIPVLGEAAGIEWQDINEEYRKGVFGR